MASLIRTLTTWVEKLLGVGSGVVSRDGVHVSLVVSQGWLEDIKQMSVTRQQICRDQLRTRTFMFYLIKTTLNENEWKQ